MSQEIVWRTIIYPPIQTLEDSLNFYGLEFEPHGMSNQGPARWLTPRNS